jgi:hypothetical protein
MNKPITTATSRHDLAQQQGLVDLGRLPDRIRRIAQFWGGATVDARPLYELTHRDGMIRNVDELRSAMTKVHDSKVRAELLDWLGSRMRARCAG